MNDQTILAAVSIIVAGLTVTIGGVAPALGQARAVSSALDAIARQPEIATTTTRTLFVGMAMVESTAIYSLVIGLVLLFANPLLG